jgi:hypothetical protein
MKAIILKGRKPKSDENKVPSDELLLATLIQAAAARGLSSTTGAYLRDKHGHHASRARKGGSCCAVGALKLSRLKKWSKYEGSLIVGNDCQEGSVAIHAHDENLFTVGAAFEQALRREVNAG